MWEVLYVTAAVAVMLALVTSIWAAVVFVAFVSVLFGYAWATK
jgi:hypothetical protein